MAEAVTPEFIAEAQEIVDSLNRGLIAAEAGARDGEVDPDQINELFRHAHSLKGISGDVQPREDDGPGPLARERSGRHAPGQDPHRRSVARRNVCLC